MNSRVNVKRVAVLSALVAVLLLALGLSYVRTHSPHPGVPQYAQVLNAASAYRQQLESKHLPIPAAVTLQELQAQGLLRPSDAKPFEGLQVTVALKKDQMAPGESLMSVRFPNGEEMVALGDGSIQQRRH